MKVCLIGPPIITELDGTTKSRADIVRRTNEPPLGILGLAALLEQMGIKAEIFDVNRFFCRIADTEDLESHTTYFDEASAGIADIEADVFGFGTIAGSYPLTIRLAAEAKRTHPDIPIVLGGPQATALDIETLDAFPFIDFVVRGEADETFPQLLETLDGSKSPITLPGITCRSDTGIIRTDDAPVVKNLDCLPMPAFHLWHGLDGCRNISLEAGRGCPFSCVFCSTSTFFNRLHRMKSPSSVIGQMKKVRQAFGRDTVHLIHDTFTVHRIRVVEFCEALLKSDDRFKWTCCARTDCIDKELLELMEKAGCTGVFFGIEVGTERMQQAIGKKLDLDQAFEAIRCAENLRIKSTVSMILGFPDETPKDLSGSVNFFMDALRCDRVTGQMYLLAPSAGSPLHDQYREKLVWDGIFPEVTIQNWRQDSADYELIRKYPQIFPDFYAIPNALNDRHYLAELRDFITYGSGRFRWLMIALHQHSGNLVEVFGRWRSWCEENNTAEKMDAEYYCSAEFRTDFLEFVGSAYLKDDDVGALAVTTLLEYENGFDRSRKRTDFSAAAPGTENKPLTDVQMVPRIAYGVTVLRLSADYQGVIEHLRGQKSLRDVPRHPVMVAERRSADGSASVLQLSPLSSALIELCDGTRDVAGIAEIFPQLQEGLERFPKEEACLFALNELVRQGLITTF